MHQARHCIASPRPPAALFARAGTLSGGARRARRPGRDKDGPGAGGAKADVWQSPRRLSPPQPSPSRRLVPTRKVAPDAAPDAGGAALELPPRQPAPAPQRMGAGWHAMPCAPVAELSCAAS
jgi:hypothetical protein